MRIIKGWTRAGERLFAMRIFPKIKGDSVPFVCHDCRALLFHVISFILFAHGKYLARSLISLSLVEASENFSISLSDRIQVECLCEREVKRGWRVVNGINGITEDVEKSNSRGESRERQIRRRLKSKGR